MKRRGRGRARAASRRPRRGALVPGPAFAWMRGLLALGLLLAPAAARAGFTDVTTAAGLDYVQYDPAVPTTCLTAPELFSCEMEWMSGGAAVADVDGDGWTDLYVTRLDAHDLLFLNQGDGSFVEASAAAGLASYDLQSNGAGFADIDNDGDPDLYVTVMGLSTDPVNSRYYLFVNDGNGVFSEEAVARGAEVPSSNHRGGYSVAFGDYDRDGWVDIQTTEWGHIFLSGPELPHTRLLHNRGDVAPGHFEDVTIAAGVEVDRSGSCLSGSACTSLAFAPAFVDLDGDDWPELVIAADFGTSRLFWNDGDGTFTEGTAAAGVGTDENGMGSTFGDYDGDGDLDWFVTSIWDPDETCEEGFCGWGYSGNRLYRYDGARSFSDQTDAAGVREGYWGWGTAFLDADNDADLDLVMTNGVRFPLTTTDDAFNDDPMRFWQNDGTGGMSEGSAAQGLTDTASGKGLLVFDYDEDGDLDLFLVNTGTDGGRLYRNDASSGNGWLRVALQGTASNRDGFGARIEVTESPGGPVQVRQVGAATHFLGQSERVAHFGLGAGPGLPVHQVVVRWPSGETTVRRNVTRNATLLLVEGVEPVPALSPVLRWLAAAGVALAAAGLRARRATAFSRAP